MVSEEEALMAAVPSQWQNEALEMVAKYPMLANWYVEEEEHPLDVLFRAIPGLEEMRTICPVTQCKPMYDATTGCDCATCSAGKGYRLTDILIHLNDRHQWTREAIADWLETLDFDLTIRPLLNPICPPRESGGEG